MDILHSRGEASAHDVQATLPDAPSYSTVRALLARLLDKGVVQKRQEGAKYIYSPSQDRQQASSNALQRVVKTFFDGSATKAVSALLGGGNKRLTDEEIEELEKLIAQNRQRQR